MSYVWAAKIPALRSTNPIEIISNISRSSGPRPFRELRNGTGGCTVKRIPRGTFISVHHCDFPATRDAMLGWIETSERRLRGSRADFCRLSRRARTLVRRRDKSELLPRLDARDVGGASMKWDANVGSDHSCGLVQKFPLENSQQRMEGVSEPPH
jgi:hypothetical protein